MVQLTLIKNALAPHQDIHEKVHKNLIYIKSNDTRLENENTIIENFKAMEKASDKLFALLDHMREESH